MRQALTSSRSIAVPATVQAGSLAVAVPRRAAERALPPYGDMVIEELSDEEAGSATAVAKGLHGPPAPPRRYGGRPR
jgi:hypothetical protein